MQSKTGLTKNKEISNGKDFINESSEMAVGKYQAKIDFTGINDDLKDEMFEIIKCDLNDNITWLKSWQELQNHIGNVLKNKNWNNSYCLFCTNNNMAINKLEHFIDAFKQFNYDSVSFYIAEKKVGATSKMFMIWNKIGGESLSYRYNKDEDMKSQFVALKKTIQKQFGIGRGIPIEIKYNPYNDANSINITNKIDSNTLTKDNMGQYWDLLENDGTASVMNFVIGDMNGKIARIICVESLQNNKNSLMLIDDKNDSDSKDDMIDWDIVFETQFLSFIKTLTNSGGADDDNVDYDELPFKVYCIKDSKIGNEILTHFNNNNNNLINFDTMKSKYELEEEVDSCDILQECFENDNKKECSFFIENKAYIMAFYQNKAYFWKPNKIRNDPDDMEWEIEFNKMKCDICKWFAIGNDDDLKIANMKDDNVVIDDHEEMCKLWEEAWYDDDESCIKLKIECTTLTKRVFCISVDLSDIDSEYKEEIEMKLNENELSDKNNYNKLCDLIDNMIGKKNETWKQHFIMIDSCNHQTVETQSDFLQLLTAYGQSSHELVNNINIKLKSLTRKKQLIEELVMYQNMWSNDDALSFDLVNCEVELDFIGNNIKNIVSCLDALTDEYQATTTEIEMSEKEKEGMKKRFDHLLGSMELEGYYRNSKVSQRILQSERDALEYKWHKSLRGTQYVLNELRPFDIKKMLSLYDETLKAAKQVENKDICLLLGHAGAGKSGVIHFMAGSHMVEDLSNPALKKVKTESVTTFINSVSISLKQAGIDSVCRGKHDSVELCDTPAFDDALPPEVAVSNFLGIPKAVSGATRVKVLIAISDSDFDCRMSGLRHLGYEIDYLISGCKDYYETGAIMSLFTNIREEKVKARCEEALRELSYNRTQDDPFMALLHEIVEKDIIIVRPLTMKREDLLSKIFSKQYGWIECPNQVFRPFVTDSSLNLIDKQISIDEAKIIRACGNDTGKINFDVIDSKLYDMLRLSQVLPEPQTIAIVRTLKQCMQHVSKAWNQKCEVVMDGLKTVSQRGLNDFKMDMDGYNTILNEAKETENLRTKYFCKNEDNVDESSCTFISEKSLYEALTNAFTFLLNQLTIKSDSLQDWHKIQVMLNVFENVFFFSNQFSVKMNALIMQLKEIEKRIIKDVSNGDFSKMNENLGLIGDCCLLNEFFDKHGCNVSLLFNNLVKNSIVVKLNQRFNAIDNQPGANNSVYGLADISDVKCLMELVNILCDRI